MQCHSDDSKRTTRYRDQSKKNGQHTSFRSRIDAASPAPRESDTRIAACRVAILYIVSAYQQVSVRASAQSSAENKTNNGDLHPVL